MSSLPRPARLTSTFVVLSAMAMVVLMVGRGTGSRWMAALSSGLVATLALSALLPALAMGGTRVSIRAPSDGMTGVPLRLGVSVRGRCWDSLVRAIDPPGPWHRAEGPALGTLEATATRGVWTAVTVEIRSAAPLGLVWWRRRMVVVLDRPLEVGPRPRPAALGVLAASGVAEGMADAAGGARAPGPGTAVRSLRDYHPGDPLRSVSWAATARHGRLLVKETEPDAAGQLTLVVDLRGDPVGAEEAAGRAAGMALAALGAGIGVVMATAEADGGRVAAVSGSVEVGRRLARAVCTHAPPSPGVAGAVSIQTGIQAGPPGPAMKLRRDAAGNVPERPAATGYRSAGRR
ncbi:MAG: DUF58 domain-containing protein [Acidimicrobiales bacterium]